jgi:hypothetical protein
MRRRKNSNLEIRNSKQIQMIKIQKILDEPVSYFTFRFLQFRFVSDFDIRISDFALLVFWRKRKWLR